MKRLNLLIFILSNILSFGQETLLKSEFPVRDFLVSNDSVYFIQKRDLMVKPLVGNSDFIHFMGGYGLEVFENNSTTIISLANELGKKRASIRFYDKVKKKVTHVYYYDYGNALDFLVLPEKEMFIISTVDNKITLIDYKGRPTFKKILELNTNGKSRKVIFRNNKIYYITDEGKGYSYDLHNKVNTQLFNYNSILTDFQITTKGFVICTIKGDIIKLEIDDEMTNKLKNDFIISSIIKEDNIICGSWKGDIFVFEKETLELLSQKKAHKNSIINLKDSFNEYYYSISIDKTIKKWSLKNK